MACFSNEDNEHQLKKAWEREQHNLKQRVVLGDVDDWCKTWSSTEKVFTGVTYVGGVDISFVKEDNDIACAALAVVSYPDLSLVYSKCEKVKLEHPYIPGFLAFREVNFLAKLFNELRDSEPQYLPKVILVDGNGTLHCQGFGEACHLGVILDIPTIGVAKTLYCMDGIENNQQHKDNIRSQLLKTGDMFLLTGESGKTFGAALRSCDGAINPVYVSPGHRVSLQTAVNMTLSCCKYRIPEPVRQADQLSKEYLREELSGGTKATGKARKFKQAKS